MDNPKQPMILTRLLVILHKLMVKSYCWKKKPHLYNSVNMEKSSWCLPRAFTRLTCIHGIRKYSACYLRRKVNINPSITLKWIMVNCLQDTLVQKSWITIQYLIRFKTHSTGGNPSPTLLKWPRIWEYIGQEPQGNPTTVMFKDHSNKITPNGSLLHSYISALLSHRHTSFFL